MCRNERSRRPAAATTSGRSRRREIGNALTAVSRALPEPLRVDGHRLPEGFAAGPFVHAHAVADCPSAVPAPRLVEVTAPPRVQIGRAILGRTAQVRHVVDLAGGVPLVCDLDGVIENTVHRRVVAPMWGDHPIAQAARGSDVDTVIVGRVFVIRAEHQLGIQPVDATAIPQHRLANGLFGPGRHRSAGMSRTRLMRWWADGRGADTHTQSSGSASNKLPSRYFPLWSYRPHRVPMITRTVPSLSPT